MGVHAHKQYIQGVVQLLKVLFRSEKAHRFLEAVNVPEEYRREMQGIADTVGVSYEGLLIANYYYELSKLEPDNLPEEWRGVATRSCTGIVAQHSNGTIMHARNQDYPPPFSALQYDGTFMKGDKVLFRATNFAGIVGVGGTCMVPGKFSISINARDDCIACRRTESACIADAAAGLDTFPLLQRRACERGGDFHDTVDFVATRPMISPGYFIMAGVAPGEGAVITHNATGNGTDVLRLAQGWPEGSPWFLSQTNFDHWNNAPHPQFYGNDHRQESAIKLMERIGPEAVDFVTLWDVMSDRGFSTGVWPGVFNPETIHTELIVPATGEYHTYMRHNIV